MTGVYADYHYVGTGDIGGAVSEESVKLLEATVTKGMASLPTFAGRGGRGRGQTHRRRRRRRIRPFPWAKGRFTW